MFDEEEKDTGFDNCKSTDSAQPSDETEYSLNAERMSRNKNRMERRAMKNRLGDRRSKVRLNADGTAQPDRRLANRLANAKIYQKTG